MTVEPLASVEDVVEFLGRDLTSSEETRVVPILEKASELFRRESGQAFSLGESESRLRVRAGGVVLLPQRPVVGVLSVVDDDGSDVAYTWRRQRVTLTSPGWTQWVTVTYSHGGEVPPLVRLAVAEIGAVVLRVDAAAVSGQTQSQETVGPFTRQASYAAWAVGGATRLAPDDVALARSFRNPWRQIVSMGA